MTAQRLLSGHDAGRWAEGAANARSVNFDRFGSPQGVMAAMYPYMFQDTEFLYDSFNGFELDSNRWHSDATKGIDPWSVDSGTCYSTTGGDEYALSLYGTEMWKPSKNAGVEFRWKLDVISGIQLEMGLAQIRSGNMFLPVISDIDTPAAVSGNDGIFLHRDTDQTLTTSALAVSTNSAATVTKVNVATFAPTADNWYTTRIQTVFNGSAGYDALLFVFDTNSSRMTLVASGRQSLNSATSATGTYRPWFYARQRNSTDKLVSIDYAACWMDR